MVTNHPALFLFVFQPSTSNKGIDLTLSELCKKIQKILEKNPDAAKYDAVDIELEDINGIEILDDLDDSDQNPIVVIG